jgi:hypothetical protein
VKLREPFAYFVDRSLGRRVVAEALQAAGETAHAHDDHFDVNAPDTVWLAEVTRRGWVVLTKDKNIRRNEIERTVIVDAGAACFMLGRGDVSGRWGVSLSRRFRASGECSAATMRHSARALISWANCDC